MAEKIDGLRERKCFKYIILFKFLTITKGFLGVPVHTKFRYVM